MVCAATSAAASSLLPTALPGLFEGLKRGGVFFKVGDQIRQHRQGVGAEVVLEAFNVGALRLRSQAKEREEA
mgnify:CR=1 FL=1